MPWLIRFSLDDPSQSGLAVDVGAGDSGSCGLDGELRRCEERKVKQVVCLGGWVYYEIITSCFFFFLNILCGCMV